MKFRYIRWMIKTALLYMVGGMGLGLCLYLAQRVSWFEWALAWRTAHVHLLVVGVIMQLIMGVALWMFPRHQKEPYVTPEREGMTVYFLLNAGIVLRTFAEPMGVDSSIMYWMAFGGMVLQMAASVYFLFLIFGRVRGIPPPSS